MAHNLSFGATGDVRLWLERCLASERGVIVGPFATRGNCIRHRQRIYSYRVKERQTNMEIYPEGHPMRGRSVYDDIVVDVTPDNCLKLRKTMESEVDIREIEE